MGGGDLLNLLIERDVFEEDFTRFYIAEVILTAAVLQIFFSSDKTYVSNTDDSGNLKLSSPCLYPP